MAKLTVYGWTGSVSPSIEVPGRTHDHQQVRLVIAAHSKAEIARLLGWPNVGRAGEQGTPSQTWNETEIAVTTAKPLTLFAGSYRKEYVEVPLDCGWHGFERETVRSS